MSVRPFLIRGRLKSSGESGPLSPDRRYPTPPFQIPSLVQGHSYLKWVVGTWTRSTSVTPEPPSLDRRTPVFMTVVTDFRSLTGVLHSLRRHRSRVCPMNRASRHDVGALIDWGSLCPQGWAVLRPGPLSAPGRGCVGGGGYRGAPLFGWEWVRAPTATTPTGSGAAVPPQAGGIRRPGGSAGPRGSPTPSDLPGRVARGSPGGRDPSGGGPASPCRAGRPGRGPGRGRGRSRGPGPPTAPSSCRPGGTGVLRRGASGPVH